MFSFVDNLPPTLQATKSVEVTVGQSVNVEFNATDPEDGPLSLRFIGSIEGSPEYTINNEGFTWTPTDVNQVAVLRY